MYNRVHVRISPVNLRANANALNSSFKIKIKFTCKLMAYSTTELTLSFSNKTSYYQGAYCIRIKNTCMHITAV